MGSRKEEEKNEKIIRGLMKLPPNRRCINCNSLGPQYVCTSFWTFICMTCSGIHREFTHRVKSVSMAKFTSQEVDALQNGGNQRAREIYLKNWDFHRQRLPDNSNVDKIREFIRSVYVDGRYAGVKSSEKPPRDAQSPRIHEDEIRRASSYHSYSQSPPYDYQYEDRRYGKQAAALTRKPGSDKARYEGKMSSIIYSPGRFSDNAYDERFANEGSGPRISDFSVSSGGEQFKSNVQSPNFHKDIKISSPSYPRSGSSSSEDVWSQARKASLETKANAKRDADGIRPPQRTASAQSTDNKFSSLRSYNSGSLVDFFSEPVQTSESLQNKAFGIPRPSGPTRSVSMDLAKAPLESASCVDLFQLPEAPSQAPIVDLFQSSVSSAAPSFKENQLTQTSQPASIDIFC
ncbi:ADP-ribosylation factor GTPase-activating protein AGD14 [Spatholobus suberectus]|nr:ADP-ribosylation factor GTPase-activating protein AGD14 [Spatholobus suberectus]